MLASATGSIESARLLSEEQAQLLLAELSHRQGVARLQDNLGNLAPPQSGEGESAAKDQAQWQDDYEELMLSLIREDCCHHLPLDHEFGEREDYKPPSFWMGAPGVMDDG